MRGEFITGRGLVIPNNVTKAGAAHILAACFRDVAPEFWIGLCDGAPDPELQIEDLDEPTLGTGGYARQQVARSSLGWPFVGEVNGQRYIESDFVIFAASGTYSIPVRRLMLVTDNNDLTGDVFALSGALPANLQITAATVEADRKFKYRIYL